MRVLTVQTIVTLFAVAATARAQAPLRTINTGNPGNPGNTSDQQRALAGQQGVTAQPGSATDRFFGTDARTLGADGRILGADGRIIYPPPLEQPLDPAHYIVDKGDVLQARVWGEQNFDIPLPIDPDGRLFIPRVGYVSAHGRT